MVSKISKDLSRFKVVTMTHKTTSVQRLKDYLIDDKTETDYPIRRLTELKESFQMDELFYLNTCNRVTFFFTSKREVNRDFLVDLFHFINPMLREDLIERHLNVTKVFTGKSALEHIFSIAASIDSLIIGEREIIGQLKDAYAKSSKHQLSGDSIRLVMEKLVVFSKKIHNETKISEKPVSVVSIAFRRMLEFVSNKDAGILMIGAGQSNQQIANLLEQHGYHNVHVFNRTLGKAQVLADKLGGKAYELADLPQFKAPFEVVISCTGANEVVLTKSDFDNFNLPTDQKVTCLDLAVPRDIDEAIVAQNQVNYIDVQSLENLANQNRAFRQKEVVKAKAILNVFLAEFELMYRQRQLELALIEIPEEVKALKARAINEVFGKDIERLDDDAKAVLQNVMNYMEKKYIGLPMKIAKKTILGLDNFKA